MLVSNLLLYGLADTLAQTLTSVLKFVPAANDPYAVKFVLERQAVDWSDIQQQQQQTQTQQQQFDMESGYEDSSTEDLVELGLVNDDDGFGNLDRHMADNASISTTSTRNTKAVGIVPLVVQPNDYNFRRLSLFMVWGM